MMFTVETFGACIILGANLAALQGFVFVFLRHDFYDCVWKVTKKWSIPSGSLAFPLHYRHSQVLDELYISIRWYFMIFYSQFLHRQHHHPGTPVPLGSVLHRRDLRASRHRGCLPPCLVPCQRHLWWLQNRPEVVSIVNLDFSLWHFLTGREHQRRLRCRTWREVEPALSTTSTIAYRSRSILSQLTPSNVSRHYQYISVDRFIINCYHESSHACYALEIENERYDMKYNSCFM